MAQKRGWIAVTVWVSAGVLAVCLSIGAWMLYDEPLEPEAQAWLDAVQARSEGESLPYQLLLGLDAPIDVQPQALGRERLAAYIAAGPSAEPQDVRSEVEQRLPTPPREELCWLFESGCLQRLNQDLEQAQRLLQTHQVLLQRYQHVLSLDDLRTTARPGMDEPLPVYSVMQEGNRLLALQALLMAHQGDAEGARSLLEQDIRQLRTLLAQADNLIGKMVWIKLIAADLDALAVLRSEGLMKLNPVPDLTAAERDLQAVLQREFAAKALMFLALKESAQRQAGFSVPAMQVFYKPRQTVNLAFAKDRPMAELAALDAAQFVEEARPQGQQPLSIWQRPNNPIGVILNNVASPDLAQYIGRVHELDAKIRLFNLLPRLMPEALPDAAWLSAQADVQNPFAPGRSALWSAISGELCFQTPADAAPHPCIRAGNTLQRASKTQP